MCESRKNTSSYDLPLWVKYVWPYSRALEPQPRGASRLKPRGCGSRVGRAHRTAGRERHGRADAWADDHERLFPDDLETRKYPAPALSPGRRGPATAERGCLQTKLRLTSDETDNELKTLTRLRTNLRPPTRVSLSD